MHKTISTKTLKEEFLNLSYDEKYEKLLAISGVLKQQNFNFAEIYISLELLKKKTVVEESFLLGLYENILGFVELSEKQGADADIQELEIRLDYDMDTLEKIRKQQNIENKEKEDADDMLNKI